MEIDFKYTAEKNRIVTYYNVRGQQVKTYELWQLEKFVTDNKLNLSYDWDSECGTGMVSDPNTDFTEKEVYQDVTDYLDENWDKVTEDFYNAMNHTEFKSENKPNQLNSKKL